MEPRLPRLDQPSSPLETFANRSLEVGEHDVGHPDHAGRSHELTPAFVFSATRDGTTVLSGTPDEFYRVYVSSDPIV